MSALVQARGLALPGRLQPTDLTLEAGQFTCLIGPNGGGKTSLLHALAGIGSPQGQVTIAGTDPRGLHPHRRQHLLGYLSASRDLKWPLTAAAMIALGLPPDIDAADPIRFLELETLLERRIDRLSTGERSRVLIARAMAASPRLLLLDEPTANLDPRWQLKLIAELKARIRSSGQALLMAVHDLDTASACADRLLIMSGGRIVADGDPAEILSGPDIPAVFGIEKTAQGWRPVA